MDDDAARVVTSGANNALPACVAAHASAENTMQGDARNSKGDSAAAPSNDASDPNRQMHRAADNISGRLVLQDGDVAEFARPAFDINLLERTLHQVRYRLEVPAESQERQNAAVAMRELVLQIFGAMPRACDNRV